MRNNNPKPVFVMKGRFKGKIFLLESRLEDIAGTDSLPMLAMRGNYAAKNALEIDRYEVGHAPFYYGHINGLGYIISGKDLGL